MTALAPILEAFFTDRLMTQRGASPHTIASYRDTFTLLLGDIHQQTGKLPAQLDLSDLDPATIGAFLQQLETTRGNSPATRNARLAAIRSLFRYASLRAPEHAALIGRVLAIQPKRTTTTIVSFLTRGELDALLAAPDPGRLARAPRPRPAGLRRPDRTARLRTDRACHARRPPRHRPARLLPRKGTQRPRHAAHPAHRRRPRRLARRTARLHNQPAVRHTSGKCAIPRRRRAPGHQARRHRGADLPHAAGQEDHPAHPATPPQ
jgi:integrase